MEKRNCPAITKVSEIFTLSRESDENSCYLGFTICYPDGRIENITMDFHQEEYQQVLSLMQSRRTRALRELHLETCNDPKDSKPKCNAK